jgi:hypothetical protein
MSKVSAAQVAQAQGFLRAMNGAGQATDNNGRVYTCPQLARSEQVALISAYMEAPASLDFGAADMSARAKARAIIDAWNGRPVPAAPAKLSPTVRGFVAGLPDPIGRAKGDLEGRLRLAVSEMTAEDPSVAAEAAKQVEKLRTQLQTYIAIYE